MQIRYSNIKLEGISSRQKNNRYKRTTHEKNYLIKSSISKEQLKC
jgi:hypothetical protein